MAESDDLQAELIQLSSHLDAFFQHRLWFAPPPTADEVILAKDYWDSGRFHLDLEAFAAAQGIPDLAIAASLWNKYYNNALLPAVLPAMTALGVGLAASLENVSLVLQDKVPQAVVLHHPQESVLYLPRWSETPAPNLRTVGERSELYRVVFGALFPHLHRAIAQIKHLTRLPKSVMWGNTGNVCDFLYEELANCPGVAIAAQADRNLIFDRLENPAGKGHNPLYQTVVCQTVNHSDDSTPVMLRRTCCLLFRLPDSHYCGNCPLKNRADGVNV